MSPDDEYAFRQAELTLKENEFHLKQAEFAQHHKEIRYTRRSFWVALFSIIISAAASAAAVLASVHIANRASRSNTQQFQLSSRMTYYKNIVDGLGSHSEAVEAGSMRLLTEYIESPGNYANLTDERTGATDGIQTLAAFIEDQSVAESKGLPDFLSPEPIVVPRAMLQIKRLTQDPRLGASATDVSGANLHGISLPGFHPNGRVFAVTTDFRRATLTGFNLTAYPASLQSAFFTCANLTDAAFGKADVQFADFSGADLTGADLSEVQHLTSEQLVGAAVDKATRLPKDVTLATQTWRSVPHMCRRIVNNMTGMLAGQGYDEELPCPTSTEPWPADFPELQRFAGNRSQLAKVCDARAAG